MWLGCIWLRTMIFLTLQRSLKNLRRMWKLRRNLPATSPKRAVLLRSPLCMHQGCNLPFRQKRPSRGLEWQVPPLLVS
ncbi:hypothetical protein Q9233_003984 [Columba guinea]|nr:hypothetical protein Q9233_003984 [Columba guinea]